MTSVQVVKIGTSSIFYNGIIDYARLERLGYDIALLGSERRTDSVFVVSGAIRLGMMEQGITEKPNEPVGLQSHARIGQSLLMNVYVGGLNEGYRRYRNERMLIEKNLVASQYLVTYHNLDNTAELRNIVEGLKYDLSKGILPLVNYNDGVDPTEVVRDNDTLSAKIAKSLLAEQLVILTDVDGLLDEKGNLVEKIAEIDKGIEDLCKDNGNGTGGMATKLEAAKLLLPEGIPVIIGNIRYGLIELVDNGHKRTLISSKKEK